MLRHVVMFKLREDYNPEALQALIEGLNGLAAQIPQVVALVHGKNAGLTPVKFDYAVSVDFASAEDYHTYIAHPDHKALGAHMMQLVADVAQMQFEY